MRNFIGDGINIDGRMIDYQLFTATQYLEEKMGLEEDAIGEFIEQNDEVFERISQVIAIKQSIYLLRRTSHSCQSLSDSMYSLKMRLIHELRDNYNFEFDDDFVEQYGK